jgi:hypothetical protein
MEQAVLTLVWYDEALSGLFGAEIERGMEDVDCSELRVDTPTLPSAVFGGAHNYKEW